MKEMSNCYAYEAQNLTTLQKICPHSGHASHSRTPTPESIPASSPLASTVESTDSLLGPDSTADSSVLPEPKTCPVIFTQEVDPELIKYSLEDRIAYLTDFLNFTTYDAEVIQRVGPSVNNIIPGLVDDLYAKLFEFDITKKVFMTRNQVHVVHSASTLAAEMDVRHQGFEGPLPTKLEDLTLDSAQITFRKVCATRILLGAQAMSMTSPFPHAGLHEGLGTQGPHF